MSVEEEFAWAIQFVKEADHDALMRWCDALLDAAGRTLVTETELFLALNGSQSDPDDPAAA